MFTLFLTVIIALIPLTISLFPVQTERGGSAKEVQEDPYSANRWQAVSWNIY